MRRLRLLKVLVQPILVAEDDDGNLREVVEPAHSIDAAEWPGYSERSLQELEESQRELNELDFSKPK